VALLRTAGAAIIGTVNMEEAALGAVTNNPHFGKTHNPLRHGYTAGGSSGGSAAAVAAHMVRVALGTDTMGSCRIPAAYCGVVGFKPSYGRISMRGVEPLSRRLDHVGILANTVADVRDVFAVLDFFDANDAGARQYDYAPATQVKPSRLAVLDEASRAGLDADVRRDYEGALDTIARAGYQLTERAVDQTKLAAARRAGLLICEAELSVTLADLLAKDDGGVSANLRKLIAFGAAKSAADISIAHAAIDTTASVLRDQLADVDALCWPTAPQTAFDFAAPIPANQADFTCLANFTGAPAISLPIPGLPASMPSSLQLMMAPGCDAALLGLADLLATIVESNR
jgi:aspartyl-tRNA(Asn)/glutamyl-tRNA(Gln) amidotransferase subunit A